MSQDEPANHVSNDEPVNHMSQDESGFLPVAIGTVIAIVATIVLGFTQPLAPGDVNVSEDPTGIWWFGVGLIASVSGIIGTIFLYWRAQRLTRAIKLTT